MYGGDGGDTVLEYCWLAYDSAFRLLWESKFGPKYLRETWFEKLTIEREGLWCTE